MEMHQIRYFLAVQKLKNFSRAAEQCHITQPALSRAIQKLETEVGGKLFIRRPGHTELTELGRVMLPRLEVAYKEVARATIDAATLVGARKQRLRLGVMCTIGPGRIVELLKSLRDTVPDLDLTLIEANGRDVLQALINDEADAALVGLPTYPEFCEAIALYKEHYNLAFPSGHRFARLKQVSMTELEGEDYIERINCEFDDHFEVAHGEWQIDLNLRYRSAREDWVQSMIRAGLGIAILPHSFPLLRGVRSAQLVGPTIERTISFLTMKDADNSAALGLLKKAVLAQDWQTNRSS